MALIHSPSIVTTNLLACFDPGNIRSYPGSGTVIRDISGNGYTGTLINGPTVDTSVSGGVFVFDGIDDYVDIPMNLSTGTYTIIGASRYVAGGARGRLISAKNNNWLMGNWGSSTLNYYAGAWVTATGAQGPDDNNWRIYAATVNTSADSYSFYVNGIVNTAPTTRGTTGPDGFTLGARGGGTEFSKGQVGFLLIYNTVLTAAQIEQNFNAYRGRYGI